MAAIPIKAVNRLVLRKQHLTPDTGDASIVQIASDVCGLHGTIPTTPYLSLLARSRDFTREQLDDELYVKKSLVKVRCMRGTMYVIPIDVFPVMYAALSASTIRSCTSHCRYRGVNENDYERASKQVMTILDSNGSGMTFTEIKNLIGIQLNLSSVLTLMCDSGLIIRGPPQGGWASNKHTYHLLSCYLPKINLSGMSEDDAVARLIHAYLHALGPAGETDIAWWIGLGKAKVRTGLRKIDNAVTYVEVAGLKGSFAALKEDEQLLKGDYTVKDYTISLLPALDGYVMGYKERARYLDAKHYNYVFDRSGNAANTILRNGRIIGVWDTDMTQGPRVKVYLFRQEADAITIKKIRAEAVRTGKFIFRKNPAVKECDSMIPLSRRPAGSVMTPLKDS
ncbi:MAG TPA: winged helix DNA-binding domain-containing protein [Methanocella sp.]|nr:winged helix DNA-binding domain-containing protein [Methanocella sp.]